MDTYVAHDTLGGETPIVSTSVVSRADHEAGDLQHQTPSATVLVRERWAQAVDLCKLIAGF